ncbi:MAG: hypothetical protein QM778_17195 [Myxococcales bacterium]
MLWTFLYFVLSVPAGFFAGSLWIGAAMGVAGGGHSHNDIFLSAAWGFAGAVLGPIFYLMRKALHDSSSSRSMRPRARAAPRVMIFLALVALFAATSFWYYAAHIAELTPEHGGPVSDVPGAVRVVRASWGAGLSLLTAIVLAFCSALGERERSTGAR